MSAFRLRLGCEMRYRLPQPTPMIVLLTAHHAHVGAIERPDRPVCAPAVPISGYRDAFGNWCSRLTAPAGDFSIRVDGVIRDAGLPDPVVPDAVQHAVEDLPDDTLQFLLGSRYCETDRLMDEAWSRFAATPPGWARAQAICDHVHNWIGFDYMQARATRTAAEAAAERVGVCRDYAHLALALCRCMNIPARYCTGYVSDVGVPPPHGPMDFAAWIEVWLGGAWRTFDPRNNAPRRGRVLVARGRDAADVPLVHSFGPNVMTGFEVWADRLPN